MAKRRQMRRLAWLALLLGLAFAGLGYRLVDLQVLRHEQLSAKAQQNTRRELLLEPRRGDILDARGNPLATSALVKTVCADPLFLRGRQAEVARAVAPLLQENEANLYQRLLPRVWQNRQGRTVTNMYVVLKRKVPVETWEQIQAAMKNLSFGVEEKKLSRSEQNFYRNLRQKGIFAEDDELRYYPNQSLAAHVLGYVSTEEKEINDFTVSETTGKDGVEFTFNSKLAGVRGWRLTEIDRDRRELVSFREQDVQPRDGLNVVLTIDSVLQHIVESALADAMEKHSPISVCAVVVRPRTGEILAMATLPNYNPNERKYIPETRRNRVITDMAEPGSTFKVIAVSGALNDGIVKLTDTLDCENSHFWYAGHTLHDHGSYGILSVENIIAKSSNIGAAKIGIRLGANRLYEYIRNFGFGEATGIPLPGEVDAKKYVPPVSKWSKVTIAQLPMGQGIAVTRLQMTMAVCAIANKGWLMRPMLVDRLEDRDHHVVAKYSPQRVRQVISEAAAASMVKALKAVVSPDGTAAKAALEHYAVAGKTGTANKVEKGFYVNKFFASFIGFFPADDPEICISVSLDEPKDGGHYGGQTAAPIFKQIAERAANYLNIRPEGGEAPVLAEGVPAGPNSQNLKTATARARSEPNP
jgi:cell division protein FtsI/penicillin-binding protein 2